MMLFYGKIYEYLPSKIYLFLKITIFRPKLLDLKWIWQLFLVMRGIHVGTHVGTNIKYYKKHQNRVLSQELWHTII